MFNIPGTKYQPHVSKDLDRNKSQTFELQLGQISTHTLPPVGIPGGRLQPVLMRHPPQLSVKTRGGGGGGKGVDLGRGVGWGAVGGGFRLGGGGSQGGGACARPTTTTCIPPGGCVSGGWGVRRYVCDNSAFVLAEKKVLRVAVLPPAPLPPPPSPSPLPSPLLFPRAPRLVCEKNS